MTLGNRIRSFRKVKKLSQIELCDGICSQGMLSQIEKDKHMPNIQLLSRLCSRLGISIVDLELHTPNELFEKKELIAQMSNLFYQRKYVELFEITDHIEVNKYFFDKRDKQLIVFYKALYYGFVQKDYYKSFEMLEESLSYTYHSQKTILTYEEILIINNLAIFTMKLNLLEDTYRYIELILSTINENEVIKNNRNMTVVFFNIANIYSRLGNYEKGLAIAKMGIKWANKTDISTQIRLSHLYYEKAYNEQMLKLDTYKESYKIAYYLALNAEDEFLMKFIKSKIIIE